MSELNYSGFMAGNLRNGGIVQRPENDEGDDSTVARPQIRQTVENAYSDDEHSQETKDYGYAEVVEQHADKWR